MFADLKVPCITVCGVALYEGSAPEPEPTGPERLWRPFRLPVEYLAADAVHPLAASVVADLDLGVVAPGRRGVLDDLAEGAMDLPEARLASRGGVASIHENVFAPSHEFGLMMAREWRATTTDAGFLEDTQAVLQQTERYREIAAESCSLLELTDLADEAAPYALDSHKCRTMKQIWAATRPGAAGGFCERYSFMEWGALRECNRSESFLQLMSAANLLSPLMSFVVPVIFLALPFALLKLQGVPISLAKYVEVLQEVAKNHFIGQALSCRGSMSASNTAYFGAMLALYAFQIHGNVSTCVRYHKTLRQVNEYLIEVRAYARHAARAMRAFAELHAAKAGYAAFCAELARRAEPLEAYVLRLRAVSPFALTPGKFAEMGGMLSLFYALHDRSELRESLQYSFGFMGYIDNMRGVYDGLASRALNFATFGGGGLALRGQYYAPHRDEAFVANDCALAKNLIVSGPNASGKTTFLKAAAINVVLSQQIGCGFYAACDIAPYAHISTYLNIPDSSGRDSLFQAEARRCKEIVDAVGADPSRRHFCIFDELFSGTNPEEATAAGCALVAYLAARDNVDFVLTTHYRAICKAFRGSAVVQNRRMAAAPDPATGEMRYSYRIERGISRTRGAAEVLRALDFPEEILRDVEAAAPRRRRCDPVSVQALDIDL